MGVLELFLRPVPLRRARRTVIDMVLPSGYLLVTTTKQAPVVERARWSAVLVRGAYQIDRFLCANGRLVRVAKEETATHLLTLYQALPATASGSKR
jgi:hypothetical protein